MVHINPRYNTEGDRIVGAQNSKKLDYKNVITPKNIFLKEISKSILKTFGEY